MYNFKYGMKIFITCCKIMLSVIQYPSNKLLQEGFNVLLGIGMLKKLRKDECYEHQRIITQSQQRST